MTRYQQALQTFADTLREIEQTTLLLGRLPFTESSFPALTKWRDTLWEVHQELARGPTELKEKMQAEIEKAYEQGYKKAYTDLQNLQIRLLKDKNPLLANQIQEVLDVAKRSANPIEFALAMRRGTCWCEMGIGNPQVTEHSPFCLQIQTKLKALEGRVVEHGESQQ